MTIDVQAGSEPYTHGQTLWDYLRVTDGKPLCPLGSPAETLIMVLGSPDTAVAGHAAGLLKRGIAEKAVVSGGCHLPGMSPPRREADVIAQHIEEQGIRTECLLREPLSQNTSEHFSNTVALLKNCSMLIGGQNPPRFVVLVPTPIAEQRALATGRKRWPACQLWVDGIRETYSHYMSRTDRATALGRMVGEIERIITYPELGYMTQPDKPMTDIVMKAYEQLRRDFNTRPIPDDYSLAVQVTA